MKNPPNYLKTVETMGLGNDEVPIGPSALENILGCASIIPVIAITSPVWISYGLYQLVKVVYNKIKDSYHSKKE